MEIDIGECLWLIISDIWKCRYENICYEKQSEKAVFSKVKKEKVDLRWRFNKKNNKWWAFLYFVYERSEWGKTAKEFVGELLIAGENHSFMRLMKQKRYKWL